MSLGWTRSETRRSEEARKWERFHVEGPRTQDAMVRACDEKRRGVRRSAMKQTGRPKKRLADCVKDDLREKGLSGAEVYDRAARRRLSSHIDPT